MKAYQFHLLQQLSFSRDGLECVHVPNVLSPEFQRFVINTYMKFTPARNAKNKICRGLRWGTLANGKIYWSTNPVYQLSQDLQPEEGGKARTMDLIPTEFLDSKVVKELIELTFKTYHPEGDSNRQHYVVQVSALRYQPTLNQTCYPSPDMPHQDGFNNGIFVLYKSKGLLGGHSRVFSLELEALYETDLQAGDGIFIEDKKYFHQVLPMMVDSHLAESEEVCRCILIIRIDPASR